MILRTHPPTHLTYCLNVHPGETWAENFAAIRDKALAVRRRVAPNRRFGLGMRLSNRAADELALPANLDAFREFLAREDLYVFTINGFPYGQFHGTAVKQDVYRPDWSTPRRRDYTNRLADLLAALLPEGIDGSISTLPLSYRPWVTDEGYLAQAVRCLADTAAHLSDLESRIGRTVRLAIEPEADCYIDRTDQLVEFLQGPLLAHGAPHLRSSHGLPASTAEAALRRHIGACLDTAHAAVQFESPADALNLLRRSGVAIAKVQLSAALAAEPTPAVLERLRGFCDPVYLHQTTVRLPSGQFLRFPDLGEALASAEACQAAGDWRIHFHVPLFFGQYQGLRSTRRDLTGPFAAALPQACSHAEIETYTLGVLPDFLRSEDCVDAITKEFLWVLRHVLRE